MIRKIALGLAGLALAWGPAALQAQGRLHRARGLIREYLTGERHTARLSHGDER